MVESRIIGRFLRLLAASPLVASVGPQAIPKHPAIREEETPGTQGNRISRLSV